jgi:hypothetical protein
LSEPTPNTTEDFSETSKGLSPIRGALKCTILFFFASESISIWFVNVTDSLKINAELSLVTERVLVLSESISIGTSIIKEPDLLSIPVSLFLELKLLMLF